MVCKEAFDACPGIHDANDKWKCAKIHAYLCDSKSMGAPGVSNADKQEAMRLMGHGIGGGGKKTKSVRTTKGKSKTAKKSAAKATTSAKAKIPKKKKKLVKKTKPC